MKLLYFDDFRLGVLRGDQVHDVSSAVQDVPHLGPHDLISGVIARWDTYAAAIEEAATKAPGVPLSSVRVRPPLPRPVNLVCMAGTSWENGTLTEPYPINAFMKSPDAIIGDGDAWVLPDAPATIFEGEAEMAIVIGKTATAVSEAEAMDCVFGYVNLVDCSARGIPPAGNSFYQMKARDTFAPIGPFLVTKDEVPDPEDLEVKMWTNGTLTHEYHTSDMSYSIARCVSWVSHAHTLNPGDIVSWGTNHAGLHPAQDGDTIELETQGLGRLRITVRDDLKREWTRETRAERATRGLDGGAPQVAGKYAPAT
ncbi:MAG: fumarylacetoacetate hydrolase family protein [Dehalococcoidia bacterium]